jgi:hypothetical protein
MRHIRTIMRFSHSQMEIKQEEADHCDLECKKYFQVSQTRNAASSHSQMILKEEVDHPDLGAQGRISKMKQEAIKTACCKS